MEECPGRACELCAVRRELYAEMADETAFVEESTEVEELEEYGGTGSQKRSNGVNGVNGVGVGC